jgi:2-dehydro-3-deoxyphosphogluconate aldolase/(4S)-4-hydroxy-2-oxoglutarate aldolase
VTAEEILRRAPMIPVLTIERAEDALPLARALADGGLPVLEVTLRTPAALAAIERIAKGAPDVLLGAGTVLNVRDLEYAAAAGARFALSPGYAPDIKADAIIPFVPGVATASEVMRGLADGYQAFKFFPADTMGGPATLRAFAAPLPQARFCPTGGINAQNAASYLALENVLCVGGSWVAPTAAIRAGDWARIRALAEEAAVLAPAR